MRLRKNKDGSVFVGSLRISRGGFVIIGFMVGFAIYLSIAISVKP
jgi:preprotein translocase subunit Sss1